MSKLEAGIVRFLPLLVVALLLIGVVGYVSVKEIKNSPKSAVLSESTSGKTNITTTTTNTADVNENELDNEDKGLNNIDDLEVDIPGLKTEPLSVKNQPTTEPEASKAGSSTKQTNVESKVNATSTKGSDRSFSAVFDFFDGLLKKLNNLHF